MKLVIVAIAFIALVNAEGCWKTTYGRGVGRPIHSCPSGMEKSGLLCYKGCRSGYHGVGPVCWGKFPKSYGRGVGKPFRCSSSEHMSGLLCYKNCRSGYKGVGPVCWGTCPKGFRECGGALCVQSQSECTSNLKSMVGGVFKSAASIAKTVLGGFDKSLIDTLGETALAYTKAVCDKPGREEAEQD